MDIEAIEMNGWAGHEEKRKEMMKREEILDWLMTSC